MELTNLKKLEFLREQIENTDKELLFLMKRREKTAQNIAKIKFNIGKDIFDPKREKEILDKYLKEASFMDLDQNMIFEVFNLLIERSKKVQKEEIERLQNK